MANESEFDQQLKLAYQQDYDAIIYVATTRAAEFAKTALKIVNHGKVFGTLIHQSLDNFINYFVYKQLDGKASLIGHRFTVSGGMAHSYTYSTNLAVATIPS